MFAKHELLAGWSALTGVPSPPLEVVEFGLHDFISTSENESITAVRGARADFSGGLLFWVKAMEAMGCSTPEQPCLTTWPLSRYAEEALCEPIGPAKFAREVAERSVGLRSPLPKFVQDLAGWRAGLCMYAEWDDVVLVSELADSFMLFQWTTSD